MMNFQPQSVEQYHSDAERYGANSENDFKNSTLGEVHSAVRDMMLNEGLSTSESRIMTPEVDAQLNLLFDYNGSYPGGIEANTIHGFSLEYKQQLLDENQELITKFHVEHPDAGFKTLDNILIQKKAETKIAREHSARTILQAEGMANLGVITGTMRAIVEDPIILGSMGISALVTKGVGATAMSRALGIAKSEAIIGSVSEAMIQPGVYAWKKRIESPYTVQEAAFNIMLAGGLGAILGGGGSLIYDAATFRKAAKLSQVSPDEAAVLNRYADDLDAKPKDVELKQHFDAIEKATIDINEGVKPDIDQVLDKKPLVDGDTVELDNVSMRAIADIAMQKELNDLPSIFKRQSGDGSVTVKGDKTPEMLKRQSGTGFEGKLAKADESELFDLQAEELNAISRQMDELRTDDIDVPVEQIIDADGDTQVITKKSSELFDEIEADEVSFDGIIKCYGGVQ